MKKTGGLLLSLVAVSLLTACAKEKTVAPNAAECPTVISYSLEIKPIIHASCMTGLGPGTGCHDAWITSYTAVKGYLDANIWQSEVLVERTMPQMPNDFGIDSLSDDDYKTMKCWIEQGYPEN